MRAFAEREMESLRRENVRVTAIGRLDGLPVATRDAVRRLCEATATNDGLVLNLALNYGARRELCDAIRALTADVAAGRLDPAAIDDGSLANYLYTAGMPDPDLLIRTGGELRLSNFLLFRSPTPNSGRRRCAGRISTSTSSRRRWAPSQPGSDASGRR